MIFQSEKGAFSIVFVLITAMFLSFMFLVLHKNVSHLMEMEQKKKQNLSSEKIFQTISSNLTNLKACGNSFSSYNREITEIKNKEGDTVIFKWSKDDKVQSFYKESGFHEKTPWKIEEVKIIRGTLDDFQSDFCEKIISTDNMLFNAKENSSIQHDLSTLYVKMQNKDETSDNKEVCFYKPIYVLIDRDSIKECSTSTAMTDRFYCDEQSVTITCCRYIHTVVLDPNVLRRRTEYTNRIKEVPKDSNFWRFTIHNDPYIQRSPNYSPEVIEKSSSDKELYPGIPKEELAMEYCLPDPPRQNPKNTAVIRGICDFDKNWDLKFCCDTADGESKCD